MDVRSRARIGGVAVGLACTLALTGLPASASAHFDSSSGHGAYFHVTVSNFAVAQGIPADYPTVLIRIVAFADNHPEDHQLSFIRLNPRRMPKEKLAVYLHPDCTPKEAVHLETSFAGVRGNENEVSTRGVPGNGLVASEARTPESWARLTSAVQAGFTDHTQLGGGTTTRRPTQTARVTGKYVQFDAEFGYDGLKNVPCDTALNLRQMDKQIKLRFPDAAKAVNNIADTDGDGLNNADEKASGTNPKSAGSHPSGPGFKTPPAPVCAPNCPPPPATTPGQANLTATKNKSVYIPLGCATQTGLVLDYCTGTAVLLTDGRPIAYTTFAIGRGDQISVRFDVPGLFPVKAMVPNWDVIFDRALRKTKKGKKPNPDLATLERLYKQMLAGQTTLSIQTGDSLGNFSVALFPVSIKLP
jgi:hypothetical protein